MEETKFLSHLSIYDFNNNNVLADFKIRDVTDLPSAYQFGPKLSVDA